MTRRGRLLNSLLGLWLGLGGVPLVWAATGSLQGCVKTFRVVNARAQIASVPAKLCSWEMTATAANAVAAAWDSPDATTTHGQAKLVSELGAATSGNSASASHAERYTDFGLVIEATNCIVTGSYTQ